jgi:pimeloyl-ACP methyl ester carboxylesterase
MAVRERSAPAPADALEAMHALVSRYDRATFEPQGARARLRLLVSGVQVRDVVIERGGARLVAPRGTPQATISAAPEVWQALAHDPAGGLGAFRSGGLQVRKNLHLGIGFLASTSGRSGPARLRFEVVPTAAGGISTIQAGTGPALLAIHGLGGTKGSFLPTVLELGTRFRVIALDLPGFGDSDKPLRARYDAPYFARAVTALLDALELERAHLVGNSLGGRVALELGMSDPARVERLVLLCPALAWRRERPFAPLLRLARPELGLVQLAPRALIEGVVRRLIPDAERGWTAAGVEEFLRAYLTPAGRAAFYAAARHIYLDEPHGERGFWTRLRSLRPPALFVWGEHDRLVPLGFVRHVREALPAASHLELACGHVPQIERPRETHGAMARFLNAG